MILELNDYQAANLRWLLCNAHDGKIPGNIANGDWCGELRWMLEQVMIENDCTTLPNDQGYYPALVGVCNGLKREEYKRQTTDRAFALVRMILDLEKALPEEKLKWISEAAPAGCVGLDLIRAAKREGKEIPK